MLKIYVRHSMVVDKVYEILSFKQNEWLEKYICFKTQKRSKAKNVFELLKNGFFGKMLQKFS